MALCGMVYTVAAFCVPGPTAAREILRSKPPVWSGMSVHVPRACSRGHRSRAQPGGAHRALQPVVQGDCANQDVRSQVTWMCTRTSKNGRKRTAMSPFINPANNSVSGAKLVAAVQWPFLRWSETCLFLRARPHLCRRKTAFQLTSLEWHECTCTLCMALPPQALDATRRCSSDPLTSESTKLGNTPTRGQ